MRYKLNNEEFDNQKDYRKALKESDDRNHAHDIWSHQDESKLIELSETDDMSVSELADYFKRTELAIIRRLEKLVTTNEIRTKLHSNGLKKEERFNKNDIKRYLTRWYENGQKKCEGNYQGGTKRDFLPDRVGFWTEWYENGQKKFEGDWERWDGLITEWYENGQKKSESHEEDDSNLPLLSIEWYENGQKKLEENFKTKTGLLIEWYENGQKKLEGQYDESLFIDGQYHDMLSENYKDDFKKGKWTEWYKNGLKRTEGSYKFDHDMAYNRGETEKVGEWVEWYENGQKEVTIDYTDEPYCHEHLEVNCWHENGQKKFEGSFMPKINETFRSTNSYQIPIEELVKDQKWEGQCGLCIEWYENGQKKAEGSYACSYVSSYKEGEWVEWYENGQEKYTGVYRSDEKEGKWVEWYENGQKKFEGGRKTPNYLDGLCNRWDENGKKVSERYYENIQDDELDYRYIEWHDDNQGQRIIKTQYEKYTRSISNDVSKTIEWYKNGQKKLESKIYKQEPWSRHENKIIREWYKNGQKKAEGIYEIFSMLDWSNWEDGKTYKDKMPVKEGKWTHWYNNGQKKSEGDYRVGTVGYYDTANSYKDGKWIEWYKNGQKKSEKSYKLKKNTSGEILTSLKDGKWTYWHEDGQKTLEAEYD